MGMRTITVIMCMCFAAWSCCDGPCVWCCVSMYVERRAQIDFVTQAAFQLHSGGTFQLEQLWNDTKPQDTPPRSADLDLWVQACVRAR